MFLEKLDPFPSPQRMPWYRMLRTNLSTNMCYMKEVLSTPKTLRYTNTPQNFNIATTNHGPWKLHWPFWLQYIYVQLLGRTNKNHYIFVPSIFCHIHPPPQPTNPSHHHDWTVPTEEQLPPSRSDPSNPSRLNVTQPLEGLLDLAYGSPTIGGR